jgi:serine/threonine protein kinase
MRLEGQQLDHYQIISIIGSGGMGGVYLAEDSRIGQQVAIKVIWAEQRFYPDTLDALESARLLRREARAISQLDHPRILPLYSYGETQIGNATLLYLVMPYRPEGSLVNWMRQQYPTRPVPPKIVSHLIKQAAEALQVAHDHQIVHQDIKPSNFLIRTQANTSHIPELLLADFGIAHIATSSTNTSQNSRGTPIYMAPEQCQGKPVFASDQYALAVMTYELLTGRSPFQGDALRLMYQHLTVTPEPPSTLESQLSRELDEVLLKALRKQPEDRFASVTEFAESFAQTVAHLETTATYVLSSPIVQPVQVTPLLTSPPSEASNCENATLSLSQVETSILPSSAARSTPSVHESSDDGKTCRSPLLMAPPKTPVSISSDFVQAAQLNTSTLLPDVARTRRRDPGRLRWSVIVVSVLSLLLLLLGGVAYTHLGVSSSVVVVPHASVPLSTITITPVSKDLKQTYTLSGVTGTPDANEQQVQARQISVNTQAKNTTVNATGQGTTSGTNATGSVIISNDTGAVQTGYSAGNTFTGKSGVTVVLDASTPATLSPGTSYTEPAHAATIGTLGDIPALDINTVTNECRGKTCVKVVNNAAFTGGTDSGTYSVIKQSDIDGASNSLLAANQPDPQKVLQGQMRSNEQLVGTPRCQSNVSANHQADDRAAQVTVSVVFTCTGEVYDKRGAQALSTTLLARQATTDPGTGYALAGLIKTAVSNATLENQGTVTITVTAEGVWVYQLSQEQQRNLARLVAGKDKQAAISLLQQQPGVSLVAIQLADSKKQILSSKLEQIKVVVQSMSGV